MLHLTICLSNLYTARPDSTFRVHWKVY